MKKNEMLSEEALGKVSAGNKFFNAFDFISKNNHSKENDGIITASDNIITASDNMIIASDNITTASTSTGIEDSKLRSFSQTEEIAPLKAGHLDLHAIPGNALQNTSNPHKRRMP